MFKTKMYKKKKRKKMVINASIYILTLISRINIVIEFITIKSYCALENITNVITQETLTLLAALHAVTNILWKKSCISWPADGEGEGQSICFGNTAVF